MNLVDSCGWLEYLSDGKRADFYANALNDTKNLIVPSICILEVFKKVLHEQGEDAALQAIALMYQGKVIDLTASIAIQSAKIGLEHKMPLADSVILATAQYAQAVIWTQDEHFKGIKGVKYVPK